jgi:DNA-binding beta-propeller fold protein YncE
LSGLPIELAIAKGSVWVAELRGIVRQIDARTGNVIETIRIGLAPQAIAVDDNGVWVAVQSVS